MWLQEACKGLTGMGKMTSGQGMEENIEKARWMAVAKQLVLGEGYQGGLMNSWSEFMRESLIISVDVVLLQLGWSGKRKFEVKGISHQATRKTCTYK